jgi:molybdopterin converting factor subunit 1
MTEIVHEVLLFAALRERAGAAVVRVGLPSPATVRDLLAALAIAVPRIASALPHCRVAVAHAFVENDHPIAAGDEIALIPPVSGGHDGPRIRLTHAPLSTDDAIACVLAPSRGGVATFSGYVRRQSRGLQVDHLEYEAYEPMALAVMTAIAHRVQDEISGAALAIHHRLGRLELGECAVVIAAATPHRSGAFVACRLAIEALKRDVPIWKREFTTDGATWIGLGP